MSSTVFMVLCLQAGAATPAAAPSVAALASTAPAGSTSEMGPSNGRHVYAMHCLPCHGPAGRGDGPLGGLVSPRPRDLTSGHFRLRSTAAGRPPTDDDLLRTITRGIPGTSMIGFAFLGEAERRSVVDYVKALSPVFAQPAAPPVATGPRPPRTAAAVAAGKAVYQRLRCAGCHGDKGRGDGHMAHLLPVDDSGAPVPPRNLAAGAFKGGAAAEDIYLRLTTGMEGSAMPAVREDLAGVRERWQLAYYVESLRPPASRFASKPPASAAGHPPAAGDHIVSHRIAAALPAGDPLSPLWRQAPVLSVPMQPLLSRTTAPPDLVVRSLNRDGTVAFLLEWADPTPDRTVLRTEDFRDGVAVQLVKGTPPFVGMGDRAAPVEIWQWKADWQTQVDRGRRLPSPADDGETTSASRAPAEIVGNLAALPGRVTPVEESVAEGAGTLASKPLARQVAAGKGIWVRGYWRVVLTRALPAAGEPGDHKIAFAVWDGARRDRAGQKTISTWYALEVPAASIHAEAFR